jgi:hypothetical protein
VGLKAQAAQGVGRLEAKQSPADDGARAAAGGELADRLQVVEGAVDEATGQVTSRHRRHEGVRAGGQDQGVVGDDLALGGGDRGCLPVDRGHRVPQVDGEAELVEEPVGDQGQLGGARPVEERTQPDPVVGGATLLAEGDDVPRHGGAALDQDLEELVADHAVPRDDQRPPRLREFHA